MLHKAFKRCRRAWRELTDDDPDAQVEVLREIAQWAMDWANELIKEVERLRAELKLRNKKKRKLYGKLHGARDDHDDLVSEVESFLERLRNRELPDLTYQTIEAELEKLLEPYTEEGEDDALCRSPESAD